MDKQFIKQINGKDFVLFEGLLDTFHQNGGKKIITEIISTDPFIMQATVEGDNGTYQGIGDADESNVNQMIANHKLRMAETRAVARALRLYNNVGMCSADELGGENQESQGDKQTSQKNAVNILKLKLSELGAKDEAEALDMIDKHSGVKMNEMSELTEDKAKAILEFFNE